jgi:hypothetical protein
VDHDLVLLPPFMSVNLVSSLGSDERIGDLDSTDVEGEGVLSSLADSPDSPANVDSIIRLMASLCLHANEA